MPHRSTRRPWLALTLVVAACALAALSALAFQRDPLYALALAAGVLVLGTALSRPDIATYAVLFLLYSNLPAVSVAFHGVPKPLAAAFPLLLLVPLFRDLFVRRQPIVLTPTFFLLVLLLGVQLIGASCARDPASSFVTVGTFAVEGVLLYLLVTNVLRTREALRGATWALLAAGVLMSVVPLFQQFTGTFKSNYGGLAQVDGLGFETGEAADEGGGEERQVRLAGPIGEKNRYAQVMLVLVPIGLALVFGARRGSLRFLALGATAAITLGFTLAFSRGGAVGMGCMFAAMVALRLINLRKALFVVLGLGLVLLAVPQYWKRLETMTATVQVLDQENARSASDGAVRRRVTEMMAAVRVFLDHPAIGVGPGQFKQYAAEYGNQDALRRIEGARRAHSLYLEIAAESGVLGLTLFLAAIAATLTTLAAARRACLGTDPELTDLVTAYFLALICYLSTGVFLHLSYMRYFYLVLALGGAAAQVALRECAPAGAPRPLLTPLELRPHGGTT